MVTEVAYKNYANSHALWILPNAVTEYVQWKHTDHFQSPNKKSTILKLEFNVKK